MSKRRRSATERGFVGKLLTAHSGVVLTTLDPMDQRIYEERQERAENVL
jgi:hypothetical protein